MKPRGRERHRWATCTGELSGESESMERTGADRNGSAAGQGDESTDESSILPLAAIGEKMARCEICSSEHYNSHESFEVNGAFVSLVSAPTRSRRPESLTCTPEF